MDAWKEAVRARLADPSAAAGRPLCSRREDVRRTAPWHRTFALALPSGLRRWLLRFEARIDEQVRTFAAGTAPGSRVLDAGAGECGRADLFGHCHYVAVDLGVGDPDWDYTRLSAVADLGALPFHDGSMDAVLNVVVLEHCRDPQRVVRELARVLKPGGRLKLVAPQDWEVHQSPVDFFRYTRHGLRLLFEEAGLNVVQIRPIGGFFTVLGRRLLYAPLFFQAGWRSCLFLPIAVVAGPLGILLPLFDRFDHESNTTLGYSCDAERPS